jgi:hypothetical protein
MRNLGVSIGITIMETRVRTTATAWHPVYWCVIALLSYLSRQATPAMGPTVINKRCLFETRRAMRTTLHPEDLNIVVFVPSYLMSKSGGQTQQKEAAIGRP